MASTLVPASTVEFLVRPSKLLGDVRLFQRHRSKNHQGDLYAVVRHHIRELHPIAPAPAITIDSGRLSVMINSS